MTNLLHPALVEARQLDIVRASQLRRRRLSITIPFRRRRAGAAWSNMSAWQPGSQAHAS